jgi:hypothetical protein
VLRSRPPKRILLLLRRTKESDNRLAQSGGIKDMPEWTRERSSFVRGVRRKPDAAGLSQITNSHSSEDRLAHTKREHK